MLCVEFPEFTEAYVHAIKAVWRTPIFDQVWISKSDYQISDSCAKFLDQIDTVRVCVCMCVCVCSSTLCK
jgi:hypothetical protein